MPHDQLSRISRALLLGAMSALVLTPVSASGQDTERQMLSGTGPDDPVLWDFEIHGGAKAAHPSKIAVPSNWQQQGFGHYQYGYDRGARASDHGVYRRTFTIPAAWKDKTVRLVFDGVMTDTLVKVNGQVAGALHQGGFNRFSYDVTSLIKVGQENSLQVDVSEASAAVRTDVAERHGDYWVFGGIYRPVWLEAAPAQSIANLAIDAKADGSISADVSLASPRTATRLVAKVMDKSGRVVGQPFEIALPAGGAGRLRLHGQVPDPALWSAETPNLYTLDVTLLEGDKPLHHTTRRFGFRTFEVRDGLGLFLNGQRVMLKGVNRHSFTPETGRAISRAQAYADVRSIRAMNMNAVRMSHYSPEESFLEAADELGLYVIDELSGWQNSHDTEVGRKLVRELVERDVNHPSILLWTNGNEGGWNRDLDGDFGLYDPQQRRVLHPWETFGGIDTKHYPRYPDLQQRLNGNSLVMPTEFLHGLFDGGAGSGLDDYWRAMTASPRGAGGFIWNFADEGIARTDQGGRIDTFATYAPDGIVGPHHEKEPSWWTVKAVWSPVQIDPPALDAAFDGTLQVHNGYDFTNLDTVQFRWEWIDFAQPDSRDTDARVLASGALSGPDIAAHAAGTLKLPAAPARTSADALRLTARKDGEVLWTWVWPTALTTRQASGQALGQPAVEQDGSTLSLKAGPVSARFDRASGLLSSLQHAGRSFHVDGPRLVVARPKAKDEEAWVDTLPRAGGIYELARPMLANTALVDLGLVAEDGWAGFRLEVSSDQTHWATVYNGERNFKDGQDYAFAPRTVRALRITDLRGVRKTPVVRAVRIAGDPDRYATIEHGPLAIRSGTAIDHATNKRVAWLEADNAGGLTKARWTLSEDGRLTLAYRYTLDGTFLYHGLGFGAQGLGTTLVRTLALGPSPVWQNRMRGAELGVYDIAAHGSKVLPEPASAGYYGQPRWVRLETSSGPLTIDSRGAGYLQLGARLTDYPTTSPEFPNTAFGFMNAIPAMGAKGQAADLTGPQGQPAIAQGEYSGELTFSF